MLFVSFVIEIQAVVIWILPQVHCSDKFICNGMVGLFGTSKQINTHIALSFLMLGKGKCASWNFLVRVNKSNRIQTF